MNYIEDAELYIIKGFIGDLKEPYEGIYDKIPAATYHSWKAFSISNGLELLKSPGHYKYRINNPLEQTPAMRLGTLVHERLLEPDSFKTKYKIVPEHIKDRRTKAYLELKKEAESVNKELIDADTARRIEAIYHAVMGRDCAGTLLRLDGQSELSLVWDENGTICKGRIDKYINGDKTLIDIKTTTNASAEFFANTCFHRNYHVQAAHYAAGLAKHDMPVENVVLIAIESEPPHGVAVYMLNHRILEMGETKRQELFSILNMAQSTDNWDAYADAVIDLEIPNWVNYDNQIRVD